MLASLRASLRRSVNMLRHRERSVDRQEVAHVTYVVTDIEFLHHPPTDVEVKISGHLVE